MTVYPSKKKDKVPKELKQLKFREKIRQIHRKISQTLHPISQQGIDHIDIPDNRALGTNLGDPEQPKTWKGPWKTLRDPLDIAREIKKVNINQYNQAYNTPLGSGPLADAIGRRGDTIAANTLLSKGISHLPTDNLLPETIRLLTNLIHSYPLIDTETPTTITTEEIINTYKNVKETTSSSPSGRHVGYYKAILNDPSLVGLHSIMMTLPFRHGFVPVIWSKVTDIMLAKDPNSARCHRLRI